jgi:hypothetical protein
MKVEIKFDTELIQDPFHDQYERTKEELEQALELIEKLHEKGLEKSSVEQNAKI